MASALLDELKTEATEVRKYQLYDAVIRFIDSPGAGRGSSRERNRDPAGRSRSERKRGRRGEEREE